MRGLQPPAIENLLVGYLGSVGYRPPEEGEVAGGPDGRSFWCSEPLGEWHFLEERPGHRADLDLAAFLAREGRCEALWVEYDEEAPHLEVRYYKGPQLSYSGEEPADPHPLLQEVHVWLEIPPPAEEGLGAEFDRAFLRDRPRSADEDLHERIERILKSRSPGFRHARDGLFQAPVEEGLWVSLLFEDWKEARLLFSRYPEVGNYERRSDVLHFASPAEAMRALAPWSSLVGPRAPSLPKGVVSPSDDPARVQSYLTSYIPYCLRVVEKVLPAARRQMHR